MLWITAGAVISISGCGGDATVEADDPLQLLAEMNGQLRRHDPTNFTEVDLGEFFITRPPGEIHGALFIRFQIVGVVPVEDVEAFNEVLQRRGKRMRDAVMTSVQEIESKHLSESSYGWIKSELLPTVSNSLRTTSIRDVVFTEFSIEEQ